MQQYRTGFGGHQAPRRDLGALVVGEDERARGLAGAQMRGDLLGERRLDLGLLAAGLRRGLRLLEPLLGGLDVGQGQLQLDDVDVAHRVDRARDVDHVRVVEAAHHHQDRVGLADVRQELVAEALALRRALDEARDVDDLDDRRDDLLRLDVLADPLQALVGDRDHADVGIDRAERIVCRLGLTGRERVEDRALAHIGQADDADGEGHGPQCLPWRVPPTQAAWQAATMAPRSAVALVGLVGLGLGCGDNLGSPPMQPAATSPADFIGALAALPGVHDVTEMPTQTPGFHYFVLHFSQPVDHADPASATFLQEVSLLHRDTAAPMIVHTSGYWDYYLDSEVELTQLVAGNQISIEHRFYGTSRPDPADWSKLTIEQMAADEHAIVVALRTVYTGKFLSTGGSKGGMTAVFHRRFFPDDVDGTVPYVAPLSFAAPDERYPPFLDVVGPDACRQAVRDAATEMLMNRRAALEAATQNEATQKGYQYTRVLLGPAVESAIDSLEWAFWQYFGVSVCPQLPALDATDAAMFAFLNSISPPSDSDDVQTGLFDAYYYQAYFQLGYPDGGAAYLDAVPDVHRRRLSGLAADRAADLRRRRRDARHRRLGRAAWESPIVRVWPVGSVVGRRVPARRGDRFAAARGVAGHARLARHRAGRPPRRDRRARRARRVDRRDAGGALATRRRRSPERLGSRPRCSARCARDGTRRRVPQ